MQKILIKFSETNIPTYRNTFTKIYPSTMKWMCNSPAEDIVSANIK